jgi:endonuclease III-like uncharacterized protein
MKNKNYVGMALAALLISGSMFVSCGEKKEVNDVNALKDEAMAIHDEIMPQVSFFDKQTVKIDSLIANMSSIHANNAGIDTNQLKSELSELKGKLEGATDQMMEWMMKYDMNPEGLSEEELKAYFASEVEKVKNMRTVFENVTKEASEKLSNF